ncbi:MAG TPA: hypothetical protein VE268_09395, partial [Herpetosiphonaceae bacterium]|nr:hypothetical protein [Herpetosiphonaceae bacterium]
GTPWKKGDGMPWLEHVDAPLLLLVAITLLALASVVHPAFKDNLTRRTLDWTRKLAKVSP